MSTYVQFHINPYLGTIKIRHPRDRKEILTYGHTPISHFVRFVNNYSFYYHW